MKTRLLNFWETALDSFWFIPTLMTFGAFTLFLGTIWIDRHYTSEILQWSNRSWWLFEGGPDGARTLLTTIAGSVITVAGVVFSITIAALTLASSQFGPRLLRNFTHDTGNQLTLGVFVGTFLYCVLTLHTVRSVDENVFVPNLSLAIGMGMGLLSLLVLIYFIHHIAETIQAPKIAASVGRDLCEETRLIFPEHLGYRGQPPTPEVLPTLDGSGGAPVRATRCGYIQAIDPGAFLRALERHGEFAVLEHRPGDWVVAGDVLLRLPRPEIKSPGLFRDLSDAYIIGTHRTRTQDLEYAQNQLVEMAVRALSPAINDPFTAIACLDWIGAELSIVAKRGIPSRYRFDAEGHLRIVADPITFDGLLDAAFHLIRQNAQGNAAVLIHLLETITTVTRHTRTDDHGTVQRAALLRHAQMVHRALDTLAEPNDRADLEERFLHFQSVLKEFAPPAQPDA